MRPFFLLSCVRGNIFPMAVRDALLRINRLRCHVVQVDHRALAGITTCCFFSPLNHNASHVADPLERSLIPRKSKYLEFGPWFLCPYQTAVETPPSPRHRHRQAISLCKGTLQEPFRLTCCESGLFVYTASFNRLARDQGARRPTQGKSCH